MGWQAASYPALSCFCHVEGVLDLDFAHQRNTTAPQEYTRAEVTLGGLTGLALTYLGKPLDKRQRMTDWAQRPLTDKQIKYAVLDALCLLHIYDTLMVRTQYTPSPYPSPCKKTHEKNQKKN